MSYSRLRWLQISSAVLASSILTNAVQAVTVDIPPGYAPESEAPTLLSLPEPTPDEPSAEMLETLKEQGLADESVETGAFPSSRVLLPGEELPEEDSLDFDNLNLSAETEVALTLPLENMASAISSDSMPLDLPLSVQVDSPDPSVSDREPSTGASVASEETLIAQIMPDDTLGNETSVVVPDVSIGGSPADRIDGGAIRGTNLFHSDLAPVSSETVVQKYPY